MNGDEAIGIMDDIRRRDEARLVLQEAEGITAGRDMLHSRPVRPEPLVKPKREVTQPDDALADLADGRWKRRSDFRADMTPRKSASPPIDRPCCRIWTCVLDINAPFW